MKRHLVASHLSSPAPEEVPLKGSPSLKTLGPSTGGPDSATPFRPSAERTSSPHPEGLQRSAVGRLLRVLLEPRCRAGSILGDPTLKEHLVSRAGGGRSSKMS